MYILEFEKPIIELRKKIDELKRLLDEEEIENSDEIVKLENKANQLEKEIYSNLDRWQKTQLARHPQRPYTEDFIQQCTQKFLELHGDRSFRDDPAIIGGFCQFNDSPLMLIGHQKGRNTKENVWRNFGMPNPEGYRKSLRLMKLAEKFNVPILTIVDTMGAYPGIGAEERGQSEAIAINLKYMASLKVPVISIIMGEGGSGGALALAVGNAVLMLEHSIYSVISPEGCASILWGDSSRAYEAANCLKYTAQDLLEYGIIDEIIPEPVGGAHIRIDEAMESIRKTLKSQLKKLKGLSSQELVDNRFQKFRDIGVFSETK